MSDHTPTPWSLEANSFGTQFITGNPAEPRTSPMGVTYFDLVCGGDHPRALTEANAAFIVKAVNSHDALVKALTELRNEVSGWLGAYDPDLRQAMGNTNVAVMQDRVANAVSVLASIKERA